ncbi:hypothetical protein [Thalassobius sp. Cn5-15]|jgi:hypothetical protein|uniref:hypothetical protein n=1 Tax=Thalassobius sp. Cn5-15 TaxID=2917763 RepID=UPI001EF2E6BF|nr:hypothetical protein [Thalassobius sp. Cn5-15]MCG7494382.1 hypothetical protein [Thalassobius sp. Cn5-15]
MKSFQILASAAVAVSLAACSSSGGDSDGDIDLPAEFSNLEDLLTRADAGSLNAADASLMSGTVDMTGAIGVGDVGDSGNDEVIGNLSLSVDFNDGSVSGSATGFDVYDSNGNQGDAISGTLTIAGAAGSVSGATFDADVDGMLVDGPDNITVDGVIAGDFFDYNGDLATTGDFDATLTTSGGTENVSGGFAAIEN